MKYVDIVALLAIMQFIYFGMVVAKARGTYKIKAPAVTGHEIFERTYRVQMNTLELLVLLLPLLYIAARYWPQVYVAGAGVVYIIGRFVYWRSYVNKPSTRSLGFGLSMLPIVALIIGVFGAMLRG